MLSDADHGWLLAAMDEPRIDAAWTQLCHDVVAALAPLGIALELEVNLFEMPRAYQVHERLFKPVIALPGADLFVRVRALLCSGGALAVYLFAHDDQGFTGDSPSVLLRTPLFTTAPVADWRLAKDAPQCLAQAWASAGFQPEDAAWRTGLASACAQLDAALRP